MQLWRGLGRGDRFLTAEIGDLERAKAPISTTTSTFTASNFGFDGYAAITVRPGTRAVIWNETEQEITFLPGAKWKIFKRQKMKNPVEGVGGKVEFVNVEIGDADDPDFATMLGMGMDFDSRRAAHLAALEARAARTGRRPMSPERIARWLDCGAQGSIALGEDGQAKNPLDQPALDWSRKQIAESKARIEAAKKREAAKKPRSG